MDVAVYAWIAMAIPVFIALLFITAPYGRHTRRGWVPMVNPRIAWFFMEVPSFALMLYFAIRYWPSKLVPIVLGALWLFHYGYRSLVFPFLIRPGKNKTPLSIILMSDIFNIMNAGFNGYWLFVRQDYTKDFRLWIGIALFITGFVIHSWSDHILRNLRKSGEKGYKIPHGGLFEYVSSPNYLGEIVEWTGWAIAVWNPAGLAFLVWTIANLVPRAISNHKWYREHFSDYPENRKAIIPYIL